MASIPLGILSGRIKTLRMNLKGAAVQSSHSPCCRCYSRSTRMMQEQKKIVFLGTPEVSAEVLNQLISASKADSSFKVILAVTRPPAPAGRGKKLTWSPVHEFAQSNAIPVLFPEKAGDQDFLDTLKQVSPDLCVTAAYGNYLPKKFLEIPKFGTLNIHPSILPKWRGAAPVQRSIENGDTEVGVSVLFTALKMDAGRIIRQERTTLHGDEKAPEVLSKLMRMGTQLLVKALPEIWEQSIRYWDQDESLATHAAKFKNSDSEIKFDKMTAKMIHNKCRALSETFGTWCYLDIVDSSNTSVAKRIRIKIIETKLISDAPPTYLTSTGSEKPAIEVVMKPDLKTDVIVPHLRVICADGSLLGITMVQPETKRAMPVQDFANGLKGRKLQLVTE